MPTFKEYYTLKGTLCNFWLSISLNKIAVSGKNIVLAPLRDCADEYEPLQ